MNIIPLTDEADTEPTGYLAEGVFDAEAFAVAVVDEFEPDGIGDISRVKFVWCRWLPNRKDPERPILDMRATPGTPGAFQGTFIEVG